MMRTTTTWLKSFAVSAALVGFLANPGSAQTGSGSFGLNGTWINPGEISEGPQDNVNFDETWSPGATLEFWFGDSRRWGLGFHGTYNDWNEFDTNLAGGDFGHPVSYWTYDGSIQFRLADVDFDSRFIPLLTLGAGAITVNPEDGVLTADQQNLVGGDVVLDEETHTEWAAVGGLGFDWFMSETLSFRVLAKDYYTFQSPYRSIDTGEFHDGAHNFQVSAGLNFFWGTRAEPAPVFIPEPEPEPEPMPEPEPEPEPTERVTMCVVGPNGQLQTVTATRYLDTDRLTVMRNGTEVNFETAYPTSAPNYVQSQGWYVADRPLTLWIEGEPGAVEDEIQAPAEGVDTARTAITRLEFVRFGSPTTMTSGSLVYAGSIDGTPVYARRTDLGGVASRLNMALRTQDDLETILREDDQLADAFSNIQTFYVAVEPGDAGCVFQPISLTTYYRRTRG